MVEYFIHSKEELNSFMEELLSKLKQIQNSNSQPEWLRSKDVRKMLGISDSTLQSLRINGSLPSYKLGSSWYYKYEEIISALEAGKIGKEVNHG